MYRNLAVLEEDKTIEGMADKLRDLILNYTEQADKLKMAKESRIFRIHWDGDFFSTDYANAWRSVIEENPEIKFWTYTRSFQPEVNVVPILANLENLVLYLSVDHQNIDYAQQALADNPEAHVAYLVDYYEDAEALIKKLGRDCGHRTIPCPENVTKDNGERKLPLITEEGGACRKCKYCFDKNECHDVVFLKENLLFRAQKELPLEGLPPAEKRPTTKAPEAKARSIGESAIEFSHPSLFSADCLT
jgi:hypothetical protein